MVRFARLAVVSLSLCGVAYLCYKWSVIEFATSDKLDIPQTVDIGVLEENQPVEVSVPITNGLGHEVRIHDFTSTCGCIMVGVATETGRLVPASSHIIPANTCLELKLVLNPIAGENRQFIQRITFAVEGADSPRATIELRGKVNLGVVTYPSGLIFGKLKPGEVSELEYIVVDARHPSRRTPLKFAASCPDAAITSCSSVPRPDHLSELPESLAYYQCRVRYKAPQEACTITGDLVVQNPEGSILRRTQLTGHVVPDVYLVPNKLLLNSAGEEPWTGRALLRSNGPSSMEVLSSTPGLLVDVHDSILEVRFDPSSMPTARAGMVEIVAKLPNGQSHRLELPVLIAHR